MPSSERRRELKRRRKRLKERRKARLKEKRSGKGFSPAKLVEPVKGREKPAKEGG